MQFRGEPFQVVIFPREISAKNSDVALKRKVSHTDIWM